MPRRSFLGRSLAGGAMLSGSAAALQAPRSHLPPGTTPTAYAVPKGPYNAYLTPDYHTYTSDLVIERDRPGKPHQGKVLAAIQAHSDDVTLFAAGTVAKLIGEGYTGYLIRLSNDEKAGRTVGRGVVQNEIDNREAAKALGRNHRMDDCAMIEIRQRLMFLFRLLQVNTIFAMDPYDHYDENPDHLHAPEQLKAGLKPCQIRERYYFCRSPQERNLVNRMVDIYYVDQRRPEKSRAEEYIERNAVPI